MIPSLISDAIEYRTAIWRPCICRCGRGAWHFTADGWLVAFGLGWVVGEC